MTSGKRTKVRLVLLAVYFTATIGLLGCGGPRGGSNTPEQSPISITLTPSATAISLGQSLTVDAAVYDQSSGGATWTLTPVNFGALSNETGSSVTYTAPATFSAPTTVIITATSITNPNVTSSVRISASPITVALFPVASQTINQGEELFINPTLTNDPTSQGVTWALSPASGVGSLDGAQPFSVGYVAPANVSGPTTVTVTATSVTSSSAIASLKITVLPSGAGLNVAPIYVNGGPAAGHPYANGAFTSVTVCNPGSTSVCQTIDGILVDTGSYGLRILESQIPLLKLPKLVDGLGNTLENCASSADGSYLWGPVSSADIYISGEMATSALVQVISSANVIVPDTCSNGGTLNLNSPELLRANGILGVGPEPNDCTVAGVNFCDASVQPTAPNLYYTCPSKGCLNTDTSVIVAKTQQVTNPIPLFGQDNNGLILQLPPANDTQDSLQGTMIFGIGTEANNQLGSATIYTMDANDHFTTLYNGQTLASSFIDSGSNALYFPDTLPTCNSSKQFFCPPSITSLSAINQGATEGASKINFDVDNADNLFSAHPGNAVFSALAGSQGTYNNCGQDSESCTFVWGFPFFYGRSVYTLIDGQNPPAGTPPSPWWAY